MTIRVPVASSQRHLPVTVDVYNGVMGSPETIGMFTSNLIHDLSMAVQILVLEKLAEVKT